MQNKPQTTTTMRHLTKRQLHLLDWVKATFPAVLTLLAGFTLFRNAVIESIVSTPHPGLVYSIFFFFGLGLLLAWMSLYFFLREKDLLAAWLRLDASLRADLMAGVRWKPQLAGVYQALSRADFVSGEKRTKVLKDELSEFEKHIGNSLSLPGFIGGALVGLGLVGTFVGLLDTLQQLGVLFSSLMDVGGPNANQGELFKDMLQKLQGPMKGMGTAFVASLYGLLGSLILGIVILSVRKTAANIIRTARKSLEALIDDQSSRALTMEELEPNSQAKQQMSLDEVREFVLRGQMATARAVERMAESFDQLSSNVVQRTFALEGALTQCNNTFNDLQGQSLVVQKQLMQVMSEVSAQLQNISKSVDTGAVWVDSWLLTLQEVKRLSEIVHDGMQNHGNSAMLSSVVLEKMGSHMLELKSAYSANAVQAETYRDQIKLLLNDMHSSLRGLSSEVKTNQDIARILIKNKIERG